VVLSDSSGSCHDNFGIIWPFEVELYGDTAEVDEEADGRDVCP
jgi:hypothetical protein